MRTLVLVAVLAVPSVARADNFLEVLGGISIPIANDNWTRTAETSPKLEVRAGATGAAGDIGGMLQADWTPVSLDNSGGSSPFGNVSIAMHRFRVLADLTYHHAVNPKVLTVARVGAGIDIVHESVSGSIPLLGFNGSGSDTDTGFAFEFGGGLYYDLGSAQIGGELAIPIGHHSKHGNGSDGNYTFDYTSWDLEFLLGVRFTSR